MQQRRNLLLVLAAVVVLVGAFVVLQGSSDDDATVATTTPAETTPAATTSEEAAPAETTPADTTTAATPATTTPAEPAIPTVVVEGGQPEGGVQDLEFEKGDRVRFRIRADAADEVHLHGYDIEKPVGPGQTASFDFEAEFDGKYEIELHGTGVQIATLVVQP